jgi:hypothetical protein
MTHIDCTHRNKTLLAIISLYCQLAMVMLLELHFEFDKAFGNSAGDSLIYGMRREVGRYN